MRRGEQPQRNAEGQSHQQRPERQFQGRGAVDHHDVGDRSLVGQRGAEVAAEQPRQVLPVLGQQGSVESGFGLALGDLRRGEPTARRGGDRVTDTAHQEEHQT